MWYRTGVATAGSLPRARLMISGRGAGGRLAARDSAPGGAIAAPFRRNGSAALLGPQPHADPEVRPAGRAAGVAAPHTRRPADGAGRDALPGQPRDDPDRAHGARAVRTLGVDRPRHEDSL